MNLCPFQDKEKSASYSRVNLTSSEQKKIDSTNEEVLSVLKGMGLSLADVSFRLIKLRNQSNEAAVTANIIADESIQIKGQGEGSQGEGSHKARGQIPHIVRTVADMVDEYRDWLIDFGDGGYVTRYRFDGNTVTILAVYHQRGLG